MGVKEVDAEGLRFYGSLLTCASTPAAAAAAAAAAAPLTMTRAAVYCKGSTRRPRVQGCGGVVFRVWASGV